MNQNTQKSSRFWNFLTSSTFVIIVIIAVRTFWFDYSMVPSESMSHTFLNGDMLLVDKTAYIRPSLVLLPVVGKYFAKNEILPVGNIKRGDIIVFSHRNDNGVYYTKRVVGLPGDVVELRDDNLIINGESTMYDKDGNLLYPTKQYDLVHDDGHIELMEQRRCRIPVENGKYLIINALHSKKPRKYKDNFSYKVPPGYVFIRGDNRDHSWDSSFYTFGDVQISHINGKIFSRIFGSKVKFKQDISWAQFIIEIPYRVLRTLMTIDVTRIGYVYEYVNLDDKRVDVQNTDNINNIDKQNTDNVNNNS